MSILFALLAINLIPFCIAGPDCKITELGTEYSGKTSETSSGLKCEEWSKHHPHQHRFAKRAFSFPDGAASDAKNYCRNPNKEPGGPWCYTTDPKKKWEYCDIPFCGPEICKSTKKGQEYTGTLSKTRSGKTCQAWAKQHPHEHDQTDAAFPKDGNAAAAKNYCRNPDGEDEGPWCYTTDPNLRWEFCNVEECPLWL